jgi:hypothetical protein
MKDTGTGWIRDHPWRRIGRGDDTWLLLAEVCSD